MFDHADNGTITPNEISFVLRAFGANPKEADIKEMKQLCIEDRGNKTCQSFEINTSNRRWPEI